jgi:uncharacterized protein YjbI with pentapeptide repeats
MESDPNKLKLLRRFKETLKGRHTTASFQDAHDLSVSVAADLSRIAQNLETSKTNFSNQEQILRHGVEEWNIWRSKNPSINPDLKNLDLRGINLIGVNLSEADLSTTNLSE